MGFSAGVPTSCTRFTLAQPASVVWSICRGLVSKLWMCSGAVRVCLWRPMISTNRSSMGCPLSRCHLELFSSGTSPMTRPRAALSAAAKSIISSQVTIWNCPS